VALDTGPAYIIVGKARTVDGLPAVKRLPMVDRLLAVDKVYTVDKMHPAVDEVHIAGEALGTGRTLEFGTGKAVVISALGMRVEDNVCTVIGVRVLSIEGPFFSFNIGDISPVRIRGRSLLFCPRRRCSRHALGR
jgi:hypothetical protein